MPTDTPPSDDPPDPYTDRDIERTITMLKTDAPAIIERIELEKDADESITTWIRDAIAAGDSALNAGDSALNNIPTLRGLETVEHEIIFYIEQRFFRINENLQQSFPVTIDVPQEFWQRARLEIQYRHQLADEPIDPDEAPIDNTLLEFMQPDFQWRINGVPLDEVSTDDEYEDIDG